ncbi:MAG: YraN family protein [Dehalococcoidia bacterium]|nr:YraN family protein [Dehalococcoidia bacterium]
MKRRELGVAGEKIAKDFLRKRGYKIIESNFRCPHGEIDIIATKDNCVAFVEVRTRSGNAFGTPEESITSTKRERLISTALTYLAGHPSLPEDWRIDLLAIETDSEGKVQRLSVIENAII